LLPQWRNAIPFAPVPLLGDIEPVMPGKTRERDLQGLGLVVSSMTSRIDTYHTLGGNSGARDKSLREKKR